MGLDKMLLPQREYRICQKLVIDTSDPDVSFDEDGICNHYHTFEKQIRPLWDTGPSGRLKLEAEIERIKKAGHGKEFDCLLGMSGGVDSSYMLHKVVTEFGLRPLVFHVDAGWNSEIAVHNIECLIDNLGLQLFTEVINWNEVRDFQLALFRSGLPNIDLPQDIAFTGVLYKFAAAQGIKTILNGGNIATESVPYPLQYYYFADLRMTRAVLKSHGNVRLPTYPFTSSLYRKIVAPYGLGIHVLKPLNYIEYDKHRAMAELQERYGWKPYAQKHFESRFTRFLEGFWLPKRFGYDVRRVQFSSLILSGQMTRDEAMLALEAPAFDPALMSNDSEYIAKKLRISLDELMSYLELPLRFFWDYPNNRAFFELGEKLLWHLSKSRRGGAY